MILRTYGLGKRRSAEKDPNWSVWGAFKRLIGKK